MVVTGEAYVLLDLLNVLVQCRGRGETMRTAFERARREGLLESVPGLVYLAPEATPQEPLLVDTGLQRLVQDLDEMPHEATGLGLMEPPHRGTGLSPQADPGRPGAQARRHRQRAGHAGLQVQLPLLPDPGAQPENLALPQSRRTRRRDPHGSERYGIECFFGTDDNFFNRRETAEGILTALARAKVSGKPLCRRVRWSTEATQFDTYKNRDLLPLAERPACTPSGSASRT